MPTLPIEVVRQLGLRLVGKALAEFADGSEEIVYMTEAVVMEIQGRSANLQAMVVGDEALIGQMVLGKMDYVVDCKNRRLVGNQARPDQPVLRVK
jgi:hypothetical protein